MNDIVLVGCGAVGSCYAEETARKALAYHFPISMKIVDFDVVEERNLVSQSFYSSDLGRNKAVCSEERTRNPFFFPEAVQERIDEQNSAEILGIPDIIVDAVDNLQTRLLLWTYGRANRIPVVHLSLSPSGAGYVSWSDENFENWPYAPTISEPRLEPENPTTLRPCELNGHRSLIFNVGYFGAVSTFVYYGFDNVGMTEGFFEKNGSVRGIMFPFHANRFEAIPEKKRGYRAPERPL